MDTIQLAKGKEFNLQEETLYLCRQGILLLVAQSCLGFVKAEQVFGGGLIRQPIRALALAPAVVEPVLLSEDWLPGLCERIEQTGHLLSVIHHSDTAWRFYHFLKYLLKHHADHWQDGYLIPFRLTQEQMALILGLTRVTVTRLANPYRAQGYLGYTPERLLWLKALPAAPLSGKSPVKPA
jgi:hypothetical protein